VQLLLILVDAGCKEKPGQIAVFLKKTIPIDMGDQ
jgi:hypothetical protein